MYIQCVFYHVDSEAFFASFFPWRQVMTLLSAKSRASLDLEFLFFKSLSHSGPRFGV